jgi:YD repeat-containing protein
LFYDTLGRVTERRHSDDTSVLFEYEQSGNSGTVVITDENGHTTT